MFALNNFQKNKNMKKISLLLAALALVVTSFAKGDGEAQAYKIDTEKSKVYWTGKKVTGSSHTGYISIGDGSVHVLDGALTGAHMHIDMSTIVCTDIEDEGYNAKLVGHLNSDDFFSVDKHPISRFEITSVKKESGSEYKVHGKLEIKGISNEISFPAKINVSNGKVTASGTAEIDRTKWDVKYGSGSFFKGLGDKAIKDAVEIKFELSAKDSESTAIN